MLYRIINKDEQSQIEWLWDYCFEKKHDPFFKWYFSKYCNHDNVLGGFNGEKLLTCLHLNPYSIYLRGQVFPSSYIVGLATYPEIRQYGVVRGLLISALDEMRRRGQYINILMPSKAGFYYPYQWELCYHNFKYNIAIEELRSVAKAWGSFRIVEDMSLVYKLETVYKNFVSDKHGYIVRNQKDWENIIDVNCLEDGYVYLLEHEEEPQGYIVYQINNNIFNVIEMGYTSWQAEQALFQFIYSHRSQAEYFSWNAPLDDAACFMLSDPKKDIRLSPFMTARLVDVQKVFETMNYPDVSSEVIRIQVVDELAPWNNQTFSIEVLEGKAKVLALGTEKADITCPVGALTQLVFGRLSARELYKMNKMFPASLDKLVILDRLFPKQINFINEYF